MHAYFYRLARMSDAVYLFQVPIGRVKQVPISKNIRPREEEKGWRAVRDEVASGSMNSEHW